MLHLVIETILYGCLIMLVALDLCLGRWLWTFIRFISDNAAGFASHVFKNVQLGQSLLHYGPASLNPYKFSFDLVFTLDCF